MHQEGRMMASTEPPVAACFPAGKPGRCCQVQGCTANLAAGSVYCHRRCICARHLKAEAVKKTGHGDRLWRWCFQCGKLQPLQEFDGIKRSCRVQLQRRKEPRRASSWAATSFTCPQDVSNTLPSVSSAASLGCPAPGSGQQPQQPCDAYLAQDFAVLASTQDQLMPNNSADAWTSQPLPSLYDHARVATSGLSQQGVPSSFNALAQSLMSAEISPGTPLCNTLDLSVQLSALAAPSAVHVPVVSMAVGSSASASSSSAAAMSTTGFVMQPAAAHVDPHAQVSGVQTVTTMPIMLTATPSPMPQAVSGGCGAGTLTSTGATNCGLVAADEVEKILQQELMAALASSDTPAVPEAPPAMARPDLPTPVHAVTHNNNSSCSMVPRAQQGEPGIRHDSCFPLLHTPSTSPAVSCALPGTMQLAPDMKEVYQQPLLCPVHTGSALPPLLSLQAGVNDSCGKAAVGIEALLQADGASNGTAQGNQQNMVQLQCAYVNHLLNQAQLLLDQVASIVAVLP